LGTIREHLIQNKRHADFRVWRGSRNRDSSDDEWEESFWVLAGEHTAQVVKQVDTRRMVEETFQQANENFTLDERVQEVALDAFHVADIVHKKCMRNGFEDVEDLSDLTAEEPISNSGKGGIAQDSNFNPHVVEDALKPLYRGAKSTELASTILLLYLCMVDGMSNNFTKELFALLYGHLLLVDNCLPCMQKMVYFVLSRAFRGTPLSRMWRSSVLGRALEDVPFESLEAFPGYAKTLENVP
jgi:hypothetical protein